MNRTQQLALRARMADAAFVGNIPNAPADKAAYKALNDAEKAAVDAEFETMATALKTTKTGDNVKVDYSDVASYLVMQGKYLAIAESGDAAARNFMLAANTFQSINLNKTGVPAAVDALLDSPLPVEFEVRR